MMTFRSTVEIENGLTDIAKVALDATLDEFLDKLGEIIEEDVYNKYDPDWYNRTYTLLTDYRNMFEKYSWGYFGKGVGKGIREKEYSLPVNPTTFLHGSGNENTGVIYSVLDSPSYLEIMNDPNCIDNSNPFHFPTSLPRESFWDDFIDWCNDNFHTVFQKHFNEAVSSVHLGSSGTTT